MKNIFYYGFSKKETNDRFDIYYDKDAKLQYFNNLLSFNQNIRTEELIKIEKEYVQRLKKNNQLNSLLTFPFNTPIDPNIYRVLSENGYDIQVQEVYSVKPEVFLTMNKAIREDISISFVNNKTLTEAGKYGYEIALPFGINYANFKQNNFIPKQFLDERTEIIIAKFNDKIIGILYLHETDDYIELDGFNVNEKYQHQKVGTSMQIVAMEYAMKKKGKEVFLISDSEDTPRIMYKKQGYILQGFYYYAQKNLN